MTSIGAKKFRYKKAGGIPSPPLEERDRERRPFVSIFNCRRTSPIPFTIAAAAFVVAACSAQAELKPLPKGITRAPVVFSAGHETEAVDHGRPVVLIAAALGVKPEVFREAFSHVHPAGPGSGGPTDAEARQNKAALMNALGKYGVTNERLDAVSNFYRYPPGRGAIWKHKPATAYALVKNGAVVGYEITNGGAGYSSPPTVSVPTIKTVVAKAEISFGKDLETNGAVSAITMPQDGGK